MWKRYMYSRVLSLPLPLRRGMLRQVRRLPLPPGTIRISPGEHLSLSNGVTHGQIASAIMLEPCTPVEHIRMFALVRPQFVHATIPYHVLKVHILDVHNTWRITVDFTTPRAARMHAPASEPRSTGCKTLKQDTFILRFPVRGRISQDFGDAVHDKPVLIWCLAIRHERKAHFSPLGNGTTVAKTPCRKSCLL